MTPEQTNLGEHSDFQNELTLNVSLHNVLASLRHFRNGSNRHAHTIITTKLVEQNSTALYFSDVQSKKTQFLMKLV